MKKYLYIALAAAALTSCSSDEAIEMVEKKAVSFDNVFVNNATRAADLTAVNLADFSVYGSVEANNTQGLIFNNTKVYKPEGDSEFQYDNTQYWIASAQYDFAAFAPNTDAKWSYSLTNDKIAQTGTITFDNAAAGANQDFLFAYTKPEKTADKILTQPDAVGFTFNHMLSRVKFTFVNDFAATSNIELKVTDVHITNAYTQGTLPISNGTAGTWTAEAANATLNIDFDDAGTNAIANNSGKASTTHYYLIPVKNTYNVTFNVELIQAGVSVGKYDRTATVEIDLQKGISYDVKAILNDKNATTNELFPIEFTVNGVEGWPTNWTEQNATVQK